MIQKLPVGPVLLVYLNPAACRGLEPWHWGHLGLGKSLWWGPVLCTVRYSAASWHPLDATSTLPHSCDNQKCLQMMPKVPWGLDRPSWEPSSHFLTKRFSVHWEISSAKRKYLWKQEFVYKIVFIIRKTANMFRHWNRLCLWPLI